jgi:hypothetical protein
MLAGLAPLQAERLQVRGGPAPAADPLCFYDCSSYGSRAVAAVSDVVGPSQIVYGSDRPVVDPSPLRADLGEQFERFAAAGADLLARRAGDSDGAAQAARRTDWPSEGEPLWTERPMTAPRNPATMAP